MSKQTIPYAVKGLVLIQGEVDVVRDEIGSLHHTRNVNLKPPLLELLERHSIRTLQDTENFISHSVYSAMLDHQTGPAFSSVRTVSVKRSHFLARGLVNNFFLRPEREQILSGSKCASIELIL